jgi:hypothetical protein
MDDYAAVIAMLNHTWFGAELSPETQERLARLGEIQDFEADEVILHEGDDAKEMGILISGRLALRTLVPGARAGHDPERRTGRHLRLVRRAGRHAGPVDGGGHSAQQGPRHRGHQAPAASRKTTPSRPVSTLES